MVMPMIITTMRIILVRKLCPKKIEPALAKYWLSSGIFLTTPYQTNIKINLFYAHKFKSCI